MEEHVKQSKVAIALAKKDLTNQERVLAEFIKMSKIKRGLYSGEMVDTIPINLNMSVQLYRKTMHDLKKMGLIIKTGLVTYPNPLYIKL